MPGVGKSTIAQMFCVREPLVLNLDIDLVRRQLGQWQNREVESGILARELAIAMASAQLRSGHSVIVPQFLGRADFVLQLEEVAANTSVRFIEVLLSADLETAGARFDARTNAAAHPAHLEAAEMMRRAGGDEVVATMHLALQQVVSERARTDVIDTEGRSAEQVLLDLLAVVGD